jgi:hypothetical protein
MCTIKNSLFELILLEKPKVESSRVAELSAILPELAVMLRKRGVNKQMVYLHYCKLCSNGLEHSAFGVRLNAYIGMVKPSMRVPHKVRSDDNQSSYG